MRTPALLPIVLALFVVTTATGLTPRPTRAAELLELPDRIPHPALAAFAQSIKDLHAQAIRSKKPWTETDLQKKVPSKFLALEKQIAGVRDPAKRAEALAHLALLHAEIAWTERIAPIHEMLVDLDPRLAERLGTFDASEHFIVRTVGVNPKWGKAALTLGEAVRQGYSTVFGFDEISKVPGKRIRVLVHVDASHKGHRLFFHPTPLYHGEMRLLAPTEESLTLSGRARIVYGFCHELGHMVAMWGEYGKVEDDKHAWAHYTGSLIVEAVYDSLGNEPWPTWTAFQRRVSGKARLLKEIDGKAPGRGDADAVAALFYALGEELGTTSYGAAWKWLDEKKRIRRVNNVPYLWLDDLRDALLATSPADKADRIRALLGK